MALKESEAIVLRTYPLREADMFVDARSNRHCLPCKFFLL